MVQGLGVKPAILVHGDRVARRQIPHLRHKAGSMPVFPESCAAAAARRVRRHQPARPCPPPLPLPLPLPPLSPTRRAAGCKSWERAISHVYPPPPPHALSGRAPQRTARPHCRPLHAPYRAAGREKRGRQRLGRGNRQKPGVYSGLWQTTRAPGATRAQLTLET